jgi:hypothetical protein
MNNVKYFVLEPEVAGGFGERTCFDRSGGGLEVVTLHYKFEGWFGDELVETSSVFLATERLASQLKLRNFTGITFNQVEVTVSEIFEELQPNCKLPKWMWLRVCGEPGRDDFGLYNNARLVVSQQALEVLAAVGLSHAHSITPFGLPHPWSGSC